MRIDLNSGDRFEGRHNSPRENDIAEMLQLIGVTSVDELIHQTVPESIRLSRPLDLPAALSESAYLARLKDVASKNKVFRTFIGMGYYGTHVPQVIQRNILENPGWYTAYTPYQAEIAQGRLEALINYQTMVIDLTGLPIANASLLDEATAAAEAVRLFHVSRPADKKESHVFFVDENTHPQTISVLKNRCEPIGIELKIASISSCDVNSSNIFGVLIQYPNTEGAVTDYTNFISEAHANNIRVCMATDLLALCLLKSPGEMGADIAFGSSQRFGVPFGYGGPHAAFLSTKDEYKRQIPGRIIGMSKDKDGRPAYRMALQTREQHIKREKATSNICTAQVLLSVMAGMYATFHGPEGLKTIAARTHGWTTVLSSVLSKLGIKTVHQNYFDTLTLDVQKSTYTSILKEHLEDKGINIRYYKDKALVGISFDETTTEDDVRAIYMGFVESIARFNALYTSDDAFTGAPFVLRGTISPEKYHILATSFDEAKANVSSQIPKGLERTSHFLTNPIFNTCQSEHEMLRYMKRLENKDLSLVHSMISLGSCTMKLNATTEMVPVTWPEFCNIHPFVPSYQAAGYKQLTDELADALKEITRFDAVSLQPNSGAQGEYAGLMVIRAYHLDRGDTQRNVALIPSSAHGTNPASAVMAGMDVVIVKCDERGNIDVADLRAKAEKYADTLSCLMVTYPSTHGVFEETIREICTIIHDFGGKVYMDGANMNAQVGLTSPAHIGADVCHLNLHKTFCIPHGGGGPGMGPICVTKDLAPYLPGHPVVSVGGEKAVEAVSAAQYGSADILTISHAYISMMGGDGLTRATQMAILNANYMKERLSKHYPILYVGTHGRCAHEMIVDCRAFKKFGVEVEDIAKRLMDYGFHAPTVSFPVPGTLMIEPTESESKEELDRFLDAMISIRQEIAEVESGLADKTNNVLKNAPHAGYVITASEWKYPYSREKAAFPLPFVTERKFFVSVGRIDNAYGDRNLVCSCNPIEDYAEAN